MGWFSYVFRLFFFISLCFFIQTFNCHAVTGADDYHDVHDSLLPEQQTSKKIKLKTVTLKYRKTSDAGISRDTIRVPAFVDEINDSAKALFTRGYLTKQQFIDKINFYKRHANKLNYILGLDGRELKLLLRNMALDCHIADINVLGDSFRGLANAVNNVPELLGKVQGERYDSQLIRFGLSLFLIFMDSFIEQLGSSKVDTVFIETSMFDYCNSLAASFLMEEEPSIHFYGSIHNHFLLKTFMLSVCFTGVYTALMPAIRDKLIDKLLGIGSYFKVIFSSKKRNKEKEAPLSHVEQAEFIKIFSRLDEGDQLALFSLVNSTEFCDFLDKACVITRYNVVSDFIDHLVELEKQNQQVFDKVIARRVHVRSHNDLMDRFIAQSQEGKMFDDFIQALAMDSIKDDIKRRRLAFSWLNTRFFFHACLCVALAAVVLEIPSQLILINFSQALIAVAATNDIECEGLNFNDTLFDSYQLFGNETHLISGNLEALQTDELWSYVSLIFKACNAFLGLFLMDWWNTRHEENVEREEWERAGMGDDLVMENDDNVAVSIDDDDE